MATRRALSSVLRSASGLRAASPSPCPRAPLHHRPSPAGFLLNRAAAYASSTIDGTEGLVRDQRVLNTGSPITGGIKRTRTTISKKSGEAMMFPLQFHYEDVLRQDLLLKLNHANVMEVPGLLEIRLVPKAASDFRTQIGKLAMEIFCGQRFIQTQRDPYLKARKSYRSNPFLGSGKDTGNVSDFTGQSVLRGHGMHHFLVRILTVMSMLDSPVKIQENSIKFCMETEFCEFSPELEDHFEIFEHIRGFNVTIVTSANTKDETLLLWSGFLLKDEGEN